MSSSFHRQDSLGGNCKTTMVANIWPEVGKKWPGASWWYLNVLDDIESVCVQHHSDGPANRHISLQCSWEPVRVGHRLNECGHAKTQIYFFYLEWQIKHLSLLPISAPVFFGQGKMFEETASTLRFATRMMKAPYQGMIITMTEYWFYTQPCW